MHTQSTPIPGAHARARLPRAAALVLLLLLLSAQAAQAHVGRAGRAHGARIAIASPLSRSVSGRVRLVVRGVAHGARRVEFTLGGIPVHATRSRRSTYEGWLNTRRLHNGRYMLKVEAWYRSSRRIARRHLTVANAAPRRRSKHASAASAPVTPPATRPTTPPVQPDTSELGAPWAAAGSDGLYVPLTDAAAAAEVVPSAESRPPNSGPNSYVPTAAQLQAFRTAVDAWGRTTVRANPYNAYVTGDFTGTTDEIIQWAAAKWGIPVDWLRGEYMEESHWCQNMLGDLTTVSPQVYSEYPPQARVPNTDEVYESMGITQVKWIPDGTVGAGTEPLRWESTAFNVDYQAAYLRFSYDNPNNARGIYGDSTYQQDETWNSLGSWFNPYPWANSGQLQYVSDVQHQLEYHTWTQPLPRTASCYSG
jgi:hypothetical protein